MAIVNYTPKDDDKTLYFLHGSGMSLQGLIDKAKKVFGNIGYNEITFRVENIHTRCLTYDLHDPYDWDKYLIIEKSRDGQMNALNNRHNFDDAFYIENTIDLEDLIEYIKIFFGDVDLDDIYLDVVFLPIIDSNGEETSESSYFLEVRNTNL